MQCNTVLNLRSETRNYNDATVPPDHPTDSEIPDGINISGVAGSVLRRSYRAMRKLTCCVCPVAAYTEGSRLNQQREAPDTMMQHVTSTVMYSLTACRMIVMPQ